MPALPPASAESAIVARLRAAGCVFAEEEARLLIAEASTREDLSTIVDRRVAGEPLEYIVGWVEFCGQRIVVEPGVFVPRKRTEFLVRQAISLMAERPVVVDMCCGAGAIGAALLARMPRAEMYAADIEPAAVRNARRNLPAASVVEGDLFDPLPASLRGRVDVLVVNAPYVPTAAITWMPPEARDHEPMVTLDGGHDGLDVQRRVVAAAPSWLLASGYLLIESSKQQAPQLAEIFDAAGLAPRVAEDDDIGATIVIGRRTIH
ncbi:MAG: putative protein N(5)-glutamine methyltransferase [Actinomycetota bacterium]|nr:putative protein N(5)-glutamine methyltransferase [Actinomycetota bacterium]